MKVIIKNYINDHRIINYCPVTPPTTHLQVATTNGHEETVNFPLIINHPLEMAPFFAHDLFMLA